MVVLIFVRAVDGVLLRIQLRSYRYVVIILSCNLISIRTTRRSRLKGTSYAQVHTERYMKI